MKKIFMTMIIIFIFIFSLFGCASFNNSMITTNQNFSVQKTRFKIDDTAICIDTPSYNNFNPVKEIMIGSDFWLYISFNGLSSIDNKNGTKTVYFGFFVRIFDPNDNISFKEQFMNASKPVVIKDNYEPKWLAYPMKVPKDAKLGNYEIEIYIIDGLTDKNSTDSIYFKITGITA